MAQAEPILRLTWRRSCFLLGSLLAVACSPEKKAAPPAALPTGHYEGTLGEAPAAQRLALELRHPRVGHYEAEVLVPGLPGLSFVTDTLLSSPPTLRLARPGQHGQQLRLRQEGDFWRGTLQLDSAQLPVLLVRRGPAEPAVYRVAATAGSILFSPADESVAGPALALLPDAATAALAPQWADALAREGNIVLLLTPPADSTADETPALQAALQRLRQTPGADTARLGLWLTGRRASRLLLSGSGQLPVRPGFVVMQQLLPSPALRPALRELGQHTPVLGLYGADAGSRRQATALRNALGGRRGGQIKTIPGAGALLEAPGSGLGPQLAPAAVKQAVEWLRAPGQR